ncbi:MAG: copper amine oxidase N-terminal domain-containing protein [Candidatus Eremiobacteraeota bacterium]|nr:copper amine oxidase N-terminal domain-containing protein [Candidatus Eremiobacteraeota bacterium]
MIFRLACTATCLCIAASSLAFAKPPHKAHKAAKPIVPIAIVINGSPLSVDPPPRRLGNQLLVPVRRIIQALGLDFDREGRRIVTHAGYKTISLSVGSARAEVDGEPVVLDAPTTVIKDTLYAPLRFFTAALGAQATFDRQTNSVEIISTLVGRSGNGIIATGSRVEQVGTVSAVDLLSDPATITVSYNASVRTLSIDPNATVVIQDVNTNTSNDGELADVRAGDFAHVYLNAGGNVERIVDAFGSRAGKVAATGGGSVVLDDGQVIVPGRQTDVSLNGAAATIADLKVGDTLMVRYNIDSSEVREIIATRAATGTPAPAGPVQISGISIDPARPLKPNDRVSITLRGTPGGTASYDIGPYLPGLPLQETMPGVYSAVYTIPRGISFADVPVFGHLDVRGTQAPRAQSSDEISVASVAPGIADFAPDNGSTVNNGRPSIYATFSFSTVPVNPSTIVLLVNGRDVTSESTRSGRFIEYRPGVTYANGAVRVSVRASDYAGNTATKSWTFFIKAR